MNKHTKNSKGSKQTGREQLRSETEGKVTIGLDLGDKWTYYCVLNRGGEIIERGRARTRKAELEKLLRRYREAEVGMETGTHCGWVSRVVADCGHEPVVGHARELKKHFIGENKNDWKDAESIARILRSDRKMFHPIQLRSSEEQADLAVIRSRALLVEARTKLINGARNLVKNAGGRLPKCSSGAFARRAEAAVPEPLRPAINVLLNAVEELNAQIAESNKRIRQLARDKYPETAGLKQVNGVNDLTALTYRLTLWDPDRFKHSRDVGPYLGLVVKQQDSGTIVKELGISKTGNRYLRKLLVQSAHYILGPFGADSALRRFGQRMVKAGGGTKKAKKRAAIAVARKLAVVLHKLWYGEVYEPLYGLATGATV